MFCPVLLYAILTASAGHLTRLASRRCTDTVVEFNGIKLPRLTVDSAVYYHDTCISYLLELSKDPNEQYNEDVLTAATILRFYEQIDGETISAARTCYHADIFQRHPSALTLKPTSTPSNSSSALNRTIRSTHTTLSKAHQGTKTSTSSHQSPSVIPPVSLPSVKKSGAHFSINVPSVSQYVQQTTTPNSTPQTISHGQTGS